MSDAAQRVAENLARVRGRVAEAAAQAGRQPGEIVLVGITKYVPAEVAQLLVAAGCHDLGESRPQELWQKATAMPQAPVRWHLVGHLQRNKVRRTLSCVSLIHSVDTEALLREIDAEAARQERRIDVLLEVNISGDTEKHGFTPAELASLISRFEHLTHAHIRGLMAMAGLEGEPDRATADFRRLRLLRDELQQAASALALTELSMGMSGDLEAAISEGATMVRIGSALWEGVE